MQYPKSIKLIHTLSHERQCDDKESPQTTP